MSENTQNILLGPRLKVERAYDHIDELRSLIDPLSPELYTVEVECHINHPNTKPHASSLMYCPRKPIPETLALVIGDVVHNFRAALDHLAARIIELDPSLSTKHRFPTHAKRDDLESAPIWPVIEKALPGAKSLLLDKIRPRDGPNEKWWFFTRMDNDDKHNLLVPTVTLVELRSAPVAFAGMRIGVFTSRTNAAKPHTLIHMMHGFDQAPPIIKQDFKASVDVTFAEGSVLEGESVVQALLEVGRIVSETLDEFERLILA